MPNAKISAQDRDAAAKRYAIYGEQIANYNAGVTSSNTSNQATDDAYRAQIAKYNADAAAYNEATARGEIHHAATAEETAFLNAGGVIDGADLMWPSGDMSSEPVYLVPNKPPTLPTEPSYTSNTAAIPEEPKGWNPSIAELKNLGNPVVDAGTAEVAATKGYTVNRGIVGAEAERSKQLADPNEQPLTSNKGILARVLGGEL